MLFLITGNVLDGTRQEQLIRSLPTNGTIHTNLVFMDVPKSCKLTFVTHKSLSSIVANIDNDDTFVLLDLSYVELTANYISQIKFFLLLADSIMADVTLIGLPYLRTVLADIYVPDHNIYEDRKDKLTIDNIDKDVWPVLIADIDIEACQEHLAKFGVIDFFACFESCTDGNEETRMQFLLNGGLFEHKKA